MSPPEEHTNQADPVTEEAVNTSTEKMSEMKIKVGKQVQILWTGVALLTRPILI